MTHTDRIRERADIRPLAEDVAANISDLLRLRSLGRESSRAHQDSRLMYWLSAESRAMVRDEIEPDPWTAAEMDALAQRIRAAVVSDRSSVRQHSGRPACVPPPEIDNRSRDFAVTTPGGVVPWLELAPAAGVGRELWDEDCDTWISLPGDLPGGRYVALNVSGESMRPLMHDGDVVLVNVGATARQGDIVLARTDDGYVVKRLAKISAAGMLLESLNCDFDPITIQDSSRCVAGVVVLRWCDHQSNSLATQKDSLRLDA